MITPEIAQIDAAVELALQFKDVAPDFPVELKKLNRWIVRTTDKHPYSAYEEDKNRGPIDPHDPQFQSDYDNALGALEQTTKFAGLGFVFNYEDGLTGADFDHCVNPDTREIRADVQAILKQVNTYAEFSPSGTGIHLIGKGWQVPKTGGKEGHKVGEAEIYSGKRYFTVTGAHVPGTPLTVNAGDLSGLYDRIVRKREWAVKKNTQNLTGSQSGCVVTKKTQRLTTKYQTLMHGTITQSKDTTGSNPFVIEDADQRLEYELTIRS